LSSLSFFGAVVATVDVVDVVVVIVVVVVVVVVVMVVAVPVFFVLTKTKSGTATIQCDVIIPDTDAAVL